MVVCLPVGTVNEADTATINNHPHEFMTILYECWNLKDDNINYKKCLEAMGEGDQIREIMNANEVTGLIGDGKPGLRLVYLYTLHILFFN